MSRRVTVTSTTTSTMSALNMAMNGNAYKMIEIKKVSGPVVPLRWVAEFRRYFDKCTAVVPSD